VMPCAHCRAAAAVARADNAFGERDHEREVAAELASKLDDLRQQLAAVTAERDAEIKRAEGFAAWKDEGVRKAFEGWAHAGRVQQERDSARADLAAVTGERDALLEQHTIAVEQRRFAESRATAAEAERDFSRQRVGELERELAALIEAADQDTSVATDETCRALEAAVKKARSAIPPEHRPGEGEGP
jgi:uncharacterized coiled-coil DUF342 family protein